jgi:hypothetical protein
MADDGTGGAEFGDFIILAAMLSMLFSLVASMAAYLIIKLLLLQESPLLVRLFSFLGSSDPSLKSTQPEESYTTTQKQQSPRE